MAFNTSEEVSFVKQRFSRVGNGQDLVISFKGTEDGSAGSVIGARRGCLVCSLEMIDEKVGEGCVGKTAGCNSSEIRPNPTFLRTQCTAEVSVPICPNSSHSNDRLGQGTQRSSLHYKSTICLILYFSHWIWDLLCGYMGVSPHFLDLECVVGQ